MSRLAKRFRIWFRSWYEQQLSLPFGINQFLANFAFIQLTPHEYVELNPPSSHCGTLRLTAKDARPVVTFKYWPPGAEYKEFSNVQVILEEGSRQTRNFRFQVRQEVVPFVGLSGEKPASGEFSQWLKDAEKRFPPTLRLPEYPATGRAGKGLLWGGSRGPALDGLEERR